jgi:hypothetical protein
MNTRSDLIDFSYTLDADKIGQKIDKCQECGQDHNFKRTFENVKTSIESIPLLIEKMTQRERLEQVIIQ